MGNRLQMLGWEFEKEELCFNCRMEAVQRIQVTPSELVTQCTDCGAELHYAIRGTGARPGKAKSTPGLKYGIWRFSSEAKCPACGRLAPQEMAIDVAAGSITCSECRFTRAYGLDAVNKCWRR
jgi:hypothetical protein